LQHLHDPNHLLAIPSYLRKKKQKGQQKKYQKCQGHKNAKPESTPTF